MRCGSRFTRLIIPLTHRVQREALDVGSPLAPRVMPTIRITSCGNTFRRASPAPTLKTRRFRRNPAAATVSRFRTWSESCGRSRACLASIAPGLRDHDPVRSRRCARRHFAEIIERCTRPTRPKRRSMSSAPMACASGKKFKRRSAPFPGLSAPAFPPTSRRIREGMAGRPTVRGHSYDVKGIFRMNRRAAGGSRAAGTPWACPCRVCWPLCAWTIRATTRQ
jgi:hypothetical protein